MVWSKRWRQQTAWSMTNDKFSKTAENNNKNALEKSAVLMSLYKRGDEYEIKLLKTKKSTKLI